MTPKAFDDTLHSHAVLYPSAVARVRELWSEVLRCLPNAAAPSNLALVTSGAFELEWGSELHVQRKNDQLNVRVGNKTWLYVPLRRAARLVAGAVATTDG